MAISSKTRQVISIALILGAAATFCSCDGWIQERSVCDMTPDGSVWLTVARLSFAEAKFHEMHGRYGELVEMTDLEPGLPPDVTAGRMGSYAITIALTKDGYILRANPDFREGGRRLDSFYADQTGIVTYDRSGKPAGPNSRKM